MLLQVQKEWLLFKGDVAADHVGLVTRQELYDLAHRHWPNGLKNEELKAALTAPEN